MGYYFCHSLTSLVYLFRICNRKEGDPSWKLSNPVNFGLLEYWSDGVITKGLMSFLSNTPILHHSNAPGLYFLTLRTYMRTALTDDDSLDFRLTSRAGQVGSPENLQLIAIASLMIGDGIKVGFSGTQ